MDEIAAAAGMSKRSFFRCFGRKKTSIPASTSASATSSSKALKARPLDEPLCTSLRRMFDDVTDPAQAAGTAELRRVIKGSVSSRAAYLDRMLRDQSPDRRHRSGTCARGRPSGGGGRFVVPDEVAEHEPGDPFVLGDRPVRCHPCGTAGHFVRHHFPGRPRVPVQSRRERDRVHAQLDQAHEVVGRPVDVRRVPRPVEVYLEDRREVGQCAGAASCFRAARAASP
ncbi:hypothetical protein [Amycolatopsis sp. MEPSY49]|uniref:hypothetical protein n=1 Tax=Amycolatopsis sp. MEPSY49 TaxID=3151600 RepID=UPI003EF57D2A